jgi:hypothetical protein
VRRAAERASALVAAAVTVLAIGCHGPPVAEAPPPSGGAGAGSATGGHGGGAAGRGGAAGSAGASGSAGAAGSSGSAGAAGSAGSGAAGSAAGAGGAGAGGTTAVAGRGGAGGAGGAGGSARGGAGGLGGAGTGGTGGCPPPLFLQPSMFYSSSYAPIHSDGTSTRYYWAEQANPSVTVHYASGPNPTAILHPYQFDASFATLKWDVAVSDGLLNGLANVNGNRIEAWGPSVTDSMFPDRVYVTDSTTITVDDTYGYYTTDSAAQPGIYRWDGHGMSGLWASYAQLGINHGQALILRMTSRFMIIAGSFEAWVVDLGTKAIQRIYSNFETTIVDIIPARPHSTTGGVIIRTADAQYPATGHDYFVDISMAPTFATAQDLVYAVTWPAQPNGCSATYVNGGVLYNNRYIFETASGLMAATIAPEGTASDLTRLTDVELRYPEVTGQGELFASWQASFQWNYYRVGQL